MKSLRNPSGDVAVIYNSERAPTAAEWAECVNVLGKDPKPKKVYIRSRGGAPDSVQRSQVVALFEGVELPRFAVVTDSAVVRGTVTLLRWFWKKNIAAFAPADRDAIRAHLELPDEALGAIEAQVAAMEADLARSSQPQRARG